MRVIFLRGSVPPAHEHPEKLLYDSIEECEDMWTQLFYTVSSKLGAEGVLVYQGGEKRLEVSDFFREHWVPKLKNYNPDVEPDLIVCRGGFDYYDSFVERFPKARKIYYGAGERFFPQHTFTDYDLFLVDSTKQLEKARGMTSKKVELFFKPAATMFRPHNVQKRYDVCFIANATLNDTKGYKFLLEVCKNTGLKILSLGIVLPKFVKLAKELKVDVEWGGWFLRKHLSEKISACKIGVLLTPTEYLSSHRDSAPRIVSEYLACGLPVVMTDDIPLWYERFITKETGVLTNREGVSRALCQTVEAYDKYDPCGYYAKYLSMDKAATYLANLIEEIM